MTRSLSKEQIENEIEYLSKNIFKTKTSVQINSDNTIHINIYSKQNDNDIERTRIHTILDELNHYNISTQFVTFHYLG